MVVIRSAVGGRVHGQWELPAGAGPAQEAAGLFDLVAFVGCEFGEPAVHLLGDVGERVGSRR